MMLWLVLAVAVLFTILWMREWRRPAGIESSKDAELEASAIDRRPVQADVDRAGNPNASLGAGSIVSRERGGDPYERASGSNIEVSGEDVPTSTSLRLSGRGDGIRLAIVIDDFGRSLDEVRRFAALDASITFAVLPFETRTSEVTELLRSIDAETLLHLPMQAKGPQNPGPGALLLEMSRRELVDATKRALAGVGSVSGVNNHMGSALTEDTEAMAAVFEVIAERELFFLDSRTSSQSLGFSLARELGVAAAERSVFLDNDASQAAIANQFQRLLKEGRRSGSAIAIGHPYPNTRAVLEREVEAARKLGFEFVPVSVLLERSSSAF